MLWESLVHQLQPLLARTIYRVCRGYGPVQKDNVDDLLQETFLKIRGIRRSSVQQAVFESEDAVIKYLQVLAANTARDHFRNRTADKRNDAQTVPLEERLAALNATFGANVDQRVLVEQIDELLDTDDLGRAIFWLYYRQGFTAKEIADIPAFQLAPKGVESLLRRLVLGVRQKIIAPKSEGKFGVEAL